MDSPTFSEDLWQNVSITSLEQCENPVFYDGLYNPSASWPTNGFAPVKKIVISNCSCDDKNLPDIPKTGLFDEWYDKPEPPDTTKTRAWCIKRCPGPIDACGSLPKREPQKHWGRNIIETEHEYSSSKCVIL